MDVFLEAEKKFYEENYDEALKLLSAIDEKNMNANIFYLLGMCYKYSEKHYSLTDSIYWLKKASECKHVSANYYLGLIFYRISKKEAIKWINKSANAGHAKSQNLLGIYYKDKNQINEAEKWFKKAAKQNDFQAIYNLANLYILNMPSSEDNYKKAMSLYKKLVKLDSNELKDKDKETVAEAEYNLAHMLDGKGCLVNYKRAKSFLELASIRNHALSILTLKNLNPDISKCKKRIHVIPHYILYMDVLGYKNKLIMRSENSYLDTFDRFIMKKVVQIVESSKNILRIINPDLIIKKKIFSDNIVIAIQKQDDDWKNLLLINILMTISSTIQSAAYIQHNIAIRGSITEGNMRIDDLYIFGTGLVRAYEMEEKTKYPITSIDYSVISFINNYSNTQNINLNNITINVIKKFVTYIMNGFVLMRTFSQQEDSENDSSKQVTKYSIILKQLDTFSLKVKIDELNEQDKTMFSEPILEYINEVFNEIVFKFFKVNEIFFVDYLSIMFLDLRYTPKYLNDNLLVHKERIEQDLRFNTENDKVYEKFEWLAFYHNNFCLKKNFDISFNVDFNLDNKT